MILKHRGDDDSIVKVTELHGRLKDMLSAMGVKSKEGSEQRKYDKLHQPLGDSSPHFLGIPPVLREALKHLATTANVRDLRLLMQEYLSQFEDIEPEDMPELDFTDRTPVDWQEGVEDLKEKSIDVLWNDLGILDQVLPFFNSYSDPDGIRNPWEHEELFRTPANVVPFSPRWHQLIGILRLVQRAFEGEPMLLMDEVGIGKSLQVIAVPVVLAYFREFYDKHSRFPGAFGESRRLLSANHTNVAVLHPSKRRLARQTWQHPRSPVHCSCSCRSG
jgi:hypothetical protein